MQHDLNRLFARLGEEALQHVHDEFHRRVVVVEQQNLVERRLLGLGARLGDNAGTDAAAVPIVAVVSIAGTAARGAGRLPLTVTLDFALFAAATHRLKPYGLISKTLKPQHKVTVGVKKAKGPGSFKYRRQGLAATEGMSLV